MVFIVVDQARYDYFTRFRPLFRGGLRNLLEESAVFADAHHDHAITTTAPGHASLATGSHPARSGIVDNTWFDRQRGRRVHSLGDPDAPILPVGSERPSSPGRSPRNLLRSTLADWLKQRHPAARVFAVGGKDRAAIPLAGRSANGVYWFDSSVGQWVTSRHYRADYPAWLEALHAAKIADSYFGQPWEPLPPRGGASGKRFSTENTICIQNVAGKLEKRLGDESWLRNGLYLDYAALGRRNLRREDVERELARLLEECPAVEKAWTRTELESPASTDPRAEQFRHSLHPDRSPDVLLQYKAFHTDRLDGGTTHGSPYEYDTHVPLLLSLPGLAAGTVAERVRTVDLAPTLASLLGIPAPEGPDGVDRSELLRESAATTRSDGGGQRRQ